MALTYFPSLLPPPGRVAPGKEGRAWVRGRPMLQAEEGNPLRIACACVCFCAIYAYRYAERDKQIPVHICPCFYVFIRTQMCVYLPTNECDLDSSIKNKQAERNREKRRCSEGQRATRAGKKRERQTTKRGTRAKVATGERASPVMFSPSIGGGKAPLRDRPQPNSRSNASNFLRGEKRRGKRDEQEAHDTNHRRTGSPK